MTRVLCIEDETLIRRDIVLELEEAGYDVLEAENGEQGLLQVIKAPPDLILCDINMPVMNGLEFVKTLRRDHPEFARIPLIFLTAYSERNQIIEGKKVGADDYLTKPIDFDNLLATVEARVRQISRIEKVEEKKNQIVEVFFNDLRAVQPPKESDANISVLTLSDNADDLAELRNKLEDRNYVFLNVDRWDKLEASLERLVPDLVVISMKDAYEGTTTTTEALRSITKRGLPMILLTPSTISNVEGMTRYTDVDEYLGLHETPTMVAWTDLADD